MTTTEKPWRGVYTAAVVQFTDDLSVDLEAYADQVRWLAENGLAGITVSGTLGEYGSLTDDERARVVSTAVESAPEGFGVSVGTGSYSSTHARRWAEQAAEAGASSVLSLPPNNYKAERDSIISHYREIASVGIPVIAYNNAVDTKVDLTPDIVAELHGEGLIVAIKDFSDDTRRPYELREKVPGLDVLAGADDLLLEFLLAGAVGWIGGFPQVQPQTSVKVFDYATSGDGAKLLEAVEIYRDVHELWRWDSRNELVQAIKLSLDVVGRPGGATRPPRGPLSEEFAAEIRSATEALIAKGYR